MIVPLGPWKIVEGDDGAVFVAACIIVVGLIFAAKISRRDLAVARELAKMIRNHNESIESFAARRYTAQVTAYGGTLGRSVPTWDQLSAKTRHHWIETTLTFDRHRPEIPKGEAVANMHMIAAAPDMHAALTAIIDAWNRGDTHDGHEALGMAEAALAKAIGATQQK